MISRPRDLVPRSEVAAQPAAWPAEASARPPALTIVVPTLEEAAGVGDFLAALVPVARALDAEVIVVDDRSRDATADRAARALGGARGRVIVRDGPRGLAAAVLEGWSRSRAPVVAVMDADLSHPPELLPALHAAVTNGVADVAVASRYAAGGGVAGWPLRRRVASRLAATLARTLVPARDPLSGYLALRRDLLAGLDLRPQGWKVGLELLARARGARLVEVPYEFTERRAGRSKFGPRPAVEFVFQVARLHVTRLRA